MELNELNHFNFIFQNKMEYLMEPSQFPAQIMRSQLCQFLSLNITGTVQKRGRVKKKRK